MSISVFLFVVCTFPIYLRLKKKQPAISFIKKLEKYNTFFYKTKEAPLSSTDSGASFSQRGWEKCSRSNKGVYVCFVIYFTGITLSWNNKLSNESGHRFTNSSNRKRLQQRFSKTNTYIPSKIMLLKYYSKYYFIAFNTYLSILAL